MDSWWNSCIINRTHSSIINQKSNRIRELWKFSFFQLCEELGLEDQVYPVAVNYLDRFLCSCSIDKKHLQLAACVCIMLASKIRQCQYVNVETLCFYTDHSITAQQIKVSCFWIFFQRFTIPQARDSLITSGSHALLLSLVRKESFSIHIRRM